MPNNSVYFFKDYFMRLFKKDYFIYGEVGRRGHT